jgi:hypothetical protein
MRGGAFSFPDHDALSIIGLMVSLVCFYHVQQNLGFGDRDHGKQKAKYCRLIIIRSSVERSMRSIVDEESVNFSSRCGRSLVPDQSLVVEILFYWARLCYYFVFTSISYLVGVRSTVSCSAASKNNIIS